MNHLWPKGARGSSRRVTVRLSAFPLNARCLHQRTVVLTQAGAVLTARAVACVFMDDQIITEDLFTWISCSWVLQQSVGSTVAHLLVLSRFWSLLFSKAYSSIHILCMECYAKYWEELRRPSLWEPVLSSSAQTSFQNRSRQLGQQSSRSHIRECSTSL